MDADRFDTLSRSLISFCSRRGVLAAALGGMFGLAGEEARANDKKGGKNDKKDKKDDKKCAKEEKKCRDNTTVFCLTHYDFLTATECSNAFDRCCKQYGKCLDGGNSCVSRTFKAWSPCGSNSQCDLGVCVGGRCTVGSCQFDADCPPGTFCTYVGGSATLSCYSTR